ncbi:MAG: tetraacyldisaccharide 4'-kinase [Candidatus Omnitrophica bacterium]|nr:tetraacyldisaccharide 4'-kinase [Candidatus Omnitrophota bacterium]MCM8826271.1 tetraacyldisaccharide 4'-kinase [Candidatus Omnitrophota bacterium]
MLKLKKAYLNLIEKEDKRILEKFIYIFLIILSYIYGIVISVRNFLSDQKIIPIYSLNKKVIGVGNISWGGSGKTSLVIYLHKKLSSSFKVASLTKGYAKDEFMLLKNRLGDVFDGKDRISILKKLVNDYDVFILDDSFQYRKLNKDLEILVMSAKEFGINKRLIPAYIFREPLKSINRADILIITYKEMITDREKIKSFIWEFKPTLPIFFASYEFKSFLDRYSNPKDLDYFKGKYLGVLTAIGYPEGFIFNLKKLGLQIKKVFAYPDHYNFTDKDIIGIEREFTKENVDDVIITYKDFYHLDFNRVRKNYFVFNIELKLEEENFFWQIVNSKLKEI